MLNYTLCCTMALVSVGGWDPRGTGTPLPKTERWTHKAIYLFDFPVAQCGRFDISRNSKFPFSTCDVVPSTFHACINVHETCVVHVSYLCSLVQLQ